MEKYFFLKSVHEKGKVRVRAISNQIIPNSLGAASGTPVDTTLNVQCDKDSRGESSVGTVFVCTDMYKTTGFYKVNGGKITPLAEFEEDTAEGEEVLKAYARVSAGASVGEEPTKKTVSAPPTSTILGRLMKDTFLNPPSPEKDGFYVNKDTWYYLLRNVALNKNTMLIGPTGTGKTEIIQRLCKVAEKDLEIVDMGSMQDPISGLLGVHRLEGDSSVFDQASFTKHIQKENMVVMLDELSRAPSTANNILFPCLDARRQLPLEIASSSSARVIPVHKDCCFFATANMGSEYTGTQTLDRALVDRFSLVELDYMPKEMETKILVNRVGIDKKDSDLVVSLSATIRSMFKKGDLSTSISTRHTLEIASLVKDGFSIDKAFEFIVFPMYEGERKEGERSTLYSLLTSK